MAKLRPPKITLRWTIGAKLVTLIATLLIASVWGIVTLSSRFMTEQTTAQIQASGADEVAAIATQMRATLKAMTEKLQLLGLTLIQADADLKPEIRERVLHELYTNDKNFLAVFIHRFEASGPPTVLSRSVSPELATLGDSDGAKTLLALAEEKNFSMTQLGLGEPQLTVVRLSDGATNAVVLGIPLVAADAPSAAPAVPGGPAVTTAAPTASTARYSHVLTAVIRQSEFASAFSKVGQGAVFMVDRKGKLLATSDGGHALVGESLSDVEIVQEMLSGKQNNTKSFTDPRTGERMLGAYCQVGFAGLGVVAQEVEQKAYEGPAVIQRESAWVGVIILFLAFLVGYLYSGTITTPIRGLVAAAGRISQGDFAINLEPRSNDEVASLAYAFNDMAKGLEERDRVKSTFNKFHNKEIAEKLLSGEVKLGGERKEATIFFSDVRGFTAMSEVMQPEQVVEMLNEYMTRMVSIIRTYGGVVDKYVGDAIMALWGVPLSHENDAENAVRACLAMRAELANLNELRKSRGQPVLKIGMGLNTGEVIAGNIGSDEKMEYTVIGDSVNLASRIESMTKEFGTDLLISSSVQEKVGRGFVLEEGGSANVKGKSAAIRVFKVQGYFNEQGQPILVQTPYSTYEAEHSDKVKGVAPAKAHAAPVAPVAEATPAAEAVPLTEAATLTDAVPVAETVSVTETMPVTQTIPNATSLPPGAPPVPSTLEVFEKSGEIDLNALGFTPSPAEDLPVAAEPPQAVPPPSSMAPPPPDAPALVVPPRPSSLQPQMEERTRTIQISISEPGTGEPERPTGLIMKSEPPDDQPTGLIVISEENTEAVIAPAGEWYLRLGTDILGPFKVPEIEEGLRRGDLSGKFEISASREGPWVSLDRFEELKNRVA